MIPLSEPRFAGNEWAYLKECLDTNWVSSAGPHVSKFEQSVAGFLGASYAVATVNGTAALHIALLVAGVRPGDEVLMPTFTFIAAANAVRYCQAYPVFLDVEPETGNLSPACLAQFLTEECQLTENSLLHRRTGRRVSAVLPVHLYGHPADMDALAELAKAHRLAVVEDAAESLGAVARGNRLGAEGDLVCFSFNGNKVITTGGGGMIVTRQAAWAERARHLTTQARCDTVNYRHDQVGFNYRMPNLNAALGLAQMEQLAVLLNRKRIVAQTYQKEFGHIEGLRVSGEASWATSSYWLVNVFVDQAKAGYSADGLRSRLAARGIESRPLWYPVHRQMPYADCEAYRITVADRLWEQGLSLPSSPTLSDAQIMSVCVAVREVLGEGQSRTRHGGVS